MPQKVIAIRVSEEIYKEIVERAKREGYELISDYIRTLILRELGKTPPPLIKDLDRRLSKLEEGELPPKLYDRIWKLVVSAIEEQGTGGLTADSLKPILEEWLESLLAKVDRKVQDLVNPYTAKVDELMRKIAELYERIEHVETEIKDIKKKLGEQRTYTQRKIERKSGIERLREQGVVFESELGRLRNRDAFFDYLSRQGAKIINVRGERVAIDPEFWDKFKRKVFDELSTSNEDEIKLLLTKQEYKLFIRLKESGLIYYDSTVRKWRSVEPLD